ncbi:U3 small nucleolar RNA-associated protein 6 [Echria macrotheca]|uniref:U3 small nucleolar RNA-associated protein 6 n=1 Tax=Echria macrotheca TaxID=438768 RepID=A0AAJ0BLR7_9PEZI|nr:U3 small nucleolar RNA-associated protein 6 [Echria macrotheca]
MAGVSDKARFYLERAAPQLQEFKEKEIFNEEEIRSLVTKRSDFEHLILAPRARATDFLSYVEWERSLDRLRAKRCRRLNIRSSSSHASQARTFGIFERAVLKHPGCIPLWRAYLDFAAEAKASKRWRRIITRALRLHPTSAELWSLAGRRAADSGDMERARAHFLRGCRFCTGEPTLWLQYARCEMGWLAKIEAKKGGKGVRKGVAVMEAIKATEATNQEGDMISLDDSEDEDEDDLVLPDPEPTKSGKTVFDEETTKKLEQSPALNGAIPMAIFDIAKKQRFFGPAAAEAFFDLFAGFGVVSCQDRIIQHVLDVMQELYPNSAETCSCYIRQPVVGVDVNTVEFPKALRESLARLRSTMDRTENKSALAQKLARWADSILAVEDLDAALRTVLEHTKRSMEELSR